MRTLAVFLLVLSASAALGSFGFALNDEADLGTATESLYRGNLLVEDIPLEFYERGDIDWKTRIDVAGGRGYPSETRAGAVAAAPFHLVLLLWSRLFPVQGLLVAISAAGFAGGMFALRRDAWRGLSPGRVRAERLALLALPLALLVVNLPHAQPIPRVWLAPLALQLASMTIFAAGVAALDSFARRTFGPTAAGWTTVVLILGSSALYWSFGQKYHAVQLALVGLVLRLRFEAQASLRAHAVAASLAGLAFWWHPKTGGLLLLAVALVEAARLWRGRRAPADALKRAGVLLLALAAGLAPYALENAAAHATPLYPGYVIDVVEVPPPATGGEAPPAVEIHTPSVGSVLWQVLREQTILADLAAVPAATWDAWVWPGDVSERTHVQLGLLMVSPLLALAPFGIASRRKGLGEADAFLLTHSALLFFAYGLYAATPGLGSLDSRYLQALLPALALYAGIALRTLMRDRFRLVAAGAALGVSALLLLATLALASLPPNYTLQFHLHRRFGLAALVLTLLWAGARVALRGKEIGERAELVDAPVLALGLFPAAFFLLQHVVHHPPRAIYGPEGNVLVSHFMPLVGQMSALLDGLWGV